MINGGIPDPASRDWQRLLKWALDDAFASLSEADQEQVQGAVDLVCEAVRPQRGAGLGDVSGKELVAAVGLYLAGRARGWRSPRTFAQARARWMGLAPRR